MKNPRLLKKAFKNRNLFYLFVASVLFSYYSCKTSNKAIAPQQTIPQLDISKFFTDSTLPEKVYQGSNKRTNDILHTKLEVSFDLKNRQLMGIATINIKPYFYPVNTLQLNAVGFEIKEVALISGNIKTKLKYIYDNKILTIDLARTFKKTENYTIYIDYISRPELLNKLDVEKENQGLYFINPLGTEKGKRTQIYTDGETQGNSCWFPTIDSPNEKFTQEISITIPKKFVSLSNGLLVWQQLNTDSTRTDIWKQNTPHSPYLTFMCIGEYAITKDVYKDKEISYYTYPEYAPYAKEIFGTTPEIIDYFSKLLGVEYPWEKYSQIVVQDYFSGAMENTSASLFGDFVQKTSKELIDENDQDFIAHELFHQWFGNLVTCESWSNTTLNEAFGTYGEYLWIEKKYGKLIADEHLAKDQKDYFEEAEKEPKELIRFFYDSKDDMFDSHSYQKGALVLHMLRNYLGDEAFFASLNLYLEKNKYSNVEYNNLRMAFEEVSGEDLNWFFNQWFLKPGHPKLSVNYQYNDTTKKMGITVVQLESEKNGFYKLPVLVDVYSKGKKESKKITITKSFETFYFDLQQQPELVNFDADKVILGEIEQTKSLGEWVFQYNKSPLFADRMEALKALSVYLEVPMVQDVFLKAMADPSQEIRIFSIKQSGILVKFIDNKLKQNLVKIAQKDDVSKVRAEALVALGENFISSDLINVYKKLLEDKSYLVQSKTLENIYYYDKDLGMAFCKSFETDSSSYILNTLAHIYSESGTEKENDFFVKNYYKFKDSEKYYLAKYYSAFLLQRNDSIINQGLDLLENIASNDNLWYIRLAGLNAITVLKNMYNDRQKDAAAKIDLLNKTKPNSVQIKQLQGKLSATERQISRISSIITSIKKSEKDSNLKEIYKSN